MPGTKRKRSNGFARASKRFKGKRTKRTIRRSSAAKRRIQGPRAVRNPPLFRHLAIRVRTTHVNKLSARITVPATGFKTDSVRFIPNLLRDPDAAARAQPFPENFLTLASLYSRYRVNSVKMMISYHGLTNNENAKFFSCVYTSSADDGTADPFPAANVADRASRDAFLQHPGIRKKMIASSGTTGGRRDNVHRVGRFSMPGIEHKRRMDMDDEDYAGAVTSTGATAGDPTLNSNIWVSGISPNFTGFPGTDTYDMSVTMVFEVEWFDRREALEGDQGESG